MLGPDWHSIMSTEKIVWTSRLEFKIKTPNREVRLDNKSALQRCALFFIFSMIATLIPFESRLKKREILLLLLCWQLTPGLVWGFDSVHAFPSPWNTLLVPTASFGAKYCSSCKSQVTCQFSSKAGPLLMHSPCTLQPLTWYLPFCVIISLFLLVAPAVMLAS